MLSDAGGKEAKALQNELAKVRGELDSLHGQVLEANAKVYKSEGAAMRTLALWSLLSQHLSGGDQSNYESDVLETLKLELDLTAELCQLLQSKVDFLQGYNIETLDEDSRTGLNLMCEKALNIVLEQQAKIRVKAPRYTTEVNPEIFPENDTRFIHTSEISHLISKFKVSALKRILDLKVKAARTTGAEAGITGGLSVTKEVIARLEAVKAMAFRAGRAAGAGMAAVAGLQNRLDSSIQADDTTSSSAPAVHIGLPGSSSRVGVPGERSAVVGHDASDNEDLDEEYSDGELSDGEFSGRVSWDSQQVLPEGIFSRELHTTVARHSNILSTVPGYSDSQWPVQGQPWNLLSQIWQGTGPQTMQFPQSEWDQYLNTLSYPLGSQRFPSLESQVGQSPASLIYQLGSESFIIPQAQVLQSPVTSEYQLGLQSFATPQAQDLSPDSIDYQLGLQPFGIPQSLQGQSSDTVECQLGFQYFPILQGQGFQSSVRFDNQLGLQTFPIPLLTGCQPPDSTEYYAGSKSSTISKSLGKQFGNSQENDVDNPSVCSPSPHNLLLPEAECETSRPSTTAPLSSFSQLARGQTRAGKHSFDSDQLLCESCEVPGKWTRPLFLQSNNTETSPVSAQPIDNPSLQMSPSYSPLGRQMANPSQVLSWKQKLPSQAPRQLKSESSQWLQQHQGPRHLKHHKASQPLVQPSFPYPVHTKRSLHTQLHQFQPQALKGQEVLSADTNARYVTRSPDFLRKGSFSKRYQSVSEQPPQYQTLLQISAPMLVPKSQPLQPDLQSLVFGHTPSTSQFQSLRGPSASFSSHQFQPSGQSALTAPPQFWCCGPSSTSVHCLLQSPPSTSATPPLGSFRPSPSFPPLQFSSLGPSPASYALISSLRPSPTNVPHQLLSVCMSPTSAAQTFESLVASPESSSPQFQSCCPSPMSAFPQFQPADPPRPYSLLRNLSCSSPLVNLQPPSQSFQPGSIDSDNFNPVTGSSQVQSFHASPSCSTGQHLSYRPPFECEAQYSGQQCIKNPRPPT